MADSKSLRIRFSNDKVLKKKSNQKEIFQKNFIIFLKRLDVKKSDQVILRELKIILKNFTKKRLKV